MKRFFLAIVLFFSLHSFGQEAELLSETNDVYEADVIGPQFNGGGIEKFHEFISSNLDRSKITKPGKIVFTFTVSEGGEIKNLRIVEFPYMEMATEIIRVIKTAPKWQPAKKAGKPISLNIRFPMDFSQRIKKTL